MNILNTLLKDSSASLQNAPIPFYTMDSMVGNTISMTRCIGASLVAFLYTADTLRMIASPISGVPS